MLWVIVLRNDKVLLSCCPETMAFLFCVEWYQCWLKMHIMHSPVAKSPPRSTCFRLHAKVHRLWILAHCNLFFWFYSLSRVLFLECLSMRLGGKHIVERFSTDWVAKQMVYLMIKLSEINKKHVFCILFLICLTVEICTFKRFLLYWVQLLTSCGFIWLELFHSWINFTTNKAPWESLNCFIKDSNIHQPFALLLSVPYFHFPYILHSFIPFSSLFLLIKHSPDAIDWTWKWDYNLTWSSATRCL